MPSAAAFSAPSPCTGGRWRSRRGPGADRYARQGELSKVETLLWKSLQIWEQALGPRDLNVATALHDLARLYRVRRKNAKALPLLERVLAIRESTLSAIDPLLAPTLRDLGEVNLAVPPR